MTSSTTKTRSLAQAAELRPRSENGLPLAGLTHALVSSANDAWRIHYESVQRKHRGDDVIVLSVGDPDLDTPAAIVESACESVRSGRTHYAATAGEPELRAAIAETESRRLGRDIQPAEICVAHGAQSALATVLRLLAEPGDEVIIFDPAYVTFEGAILLTGATPVAVPLRSEGLTWRIDLEALTTAITPRTRVILANFPHNPTGAVWHPDDLDALADICSRNKIWLISDEVYIDLVYDGSEDLVPARHPVLGPLTVTVRSLSKAYAMTGWRVGWALGPHSLMEIMSAAHTCTLYGLAQFIQDAAVTALTRGEVDKIAIRRRFEARRTLVIDAFQGANRLKLVPPASGIFAVVDVRGTGLDDKTFFRELYRETGVSVLAGSYFGRVLDGYVRMSLCANEDELAEGVRRMRAFADDLGGDVSGIAARNGAGGGG